MPVTLRRASLLILTVVMVLAAVVLLDRQQRLTTVKAPLVALVTEAQRLLAPALGRVAFPTWASDDELRQEVERLRSERDALLAEVAKLRQAQQELEQLRAQLRFQQEHPGLQLVPARVIGYDPEQPQRVLIIDQGADAGIRVGMAVLNPSVMVGIVTRVESDRAQVTVLTDPSIQLGARLLDSGAEGIVYGRGWRENGALEFRHLPPDTPVRQGELVVTSGRTAGIPPGLVIGVVTGGTRQVAEDELRLTVRPLVEFRSLESVSVLLGQASQ